MARIVDKNKTSKVYSMKAYKNKLNRDVIVCYLSLIISLIALAKAFAH